MSTLIAKRRFTFRDFRLDEGARSLRRGEVSILLMPKEFDTLVLLVAAGGEVLDKDELIKTIWPETFVGANSLTKNISVLRKHLGADSIETLSRHGYRFAWPVSEISSHAKDVDRPQSGIDQAAELSQAIPVEQTPNSRKLLSPRRVAASLLAVGVLAGLGWIAWHRPIKAVADDKILRIAVLPFQSLADAPDNDYLREGLAQELITSLGQVNPDRLQVLSRNSSALYLKADKPPTVIAGELGVRYLVEGTFRSADTRLYLTVRLVRGTDGAVLWSGKFVRPLSELQAVQTEITDAVSREIQMKILSSEAPFLRGETLDPLAHDAYLHGLADLELRTLNGSEQALAQFKNATAFDPGYARAWSGIAESYVLLAYAGPRKIPFANAKESAQRALELNPRLAVPHRVLGYVLFNGEADLQGAEREYKQALRLNPSDALAHHWYAQLLMAQKRKEEGLREARAGLSLDPLSLPSNYNYAFMLIDAGQVQAGIDYLHKLMERVPDNDVVYGYLAIGYCRLHQFAKAAPAFERARELAGEKDQYQAAVAYALAKDGKLQPAREIMADLQNKVDHGSWVPSPNMSMGYIGLGDRDRALQWLQRAVERHELTLLEVNYEPLTELAGDARFAEITCPLRGAADACVKATR